MRTHFRSAQFSVFYPQLDVSTVDFAAMSVIGQGKYLPASVLQDQDGGALAMMLSENGNSQVFVTQFSATLQVAFTPDWQVDSQKGERYLLERVPLLLTIVDAIVQRKPIYVGSSVEAELQIQGSDEDIIQVVQRWMGLHSATEETLSDIGFRKSVVENNARYLNTNISNYRDFSRGVPPTPQLRLNNDSAISRGVSVTVDYNSRYAYNAGEKVEVTEESTREMVLGAFQHTVMICGQLEREVTR